MPYRQRQTLDFRQKSIFALVGPTGSGKSALLDAITFAFFGKAPRWAETRPGKDLISQGQKKLVVEVQFQIGNKTYQVVRSVKASGAHEAQLRHQVGEEFKPLSLERRTQVQVTADLVDLLSMDYNTFTRTLMLPQGQFDRLLKPKEPKERKDLLISLAGLNIYDRLAARLSDRQRLQEHQLLQIQGQLSRYQDLDSSRLPRLEQDLLEVEESLLQSARQQEQLGQQIEELERQLEWQRQLHQAESQLRQLESQQPEIDQSRLRLERARQVESQRGHLDHLDNLRLQAREYRQKASEARNQWEQVGLRLAPLQLEYEEALRQSSQVPQLEAQRDRLQRLEESLSGYQELVEELGQLDLSALEGELQRLRQQQPQWETQKTQLEADIQRLRAQLERMEPGSQVAHWQAALEAARSLQHLQTQRDRVEEDSRQGEQELHDLGQQQGALEQDEEEARQRLEQVRQSLEGESHRRLRRNLQVDCPCPVCLQPVLRLPEDRQEGESRPGDLEQAERDYQAARDQSRALLQEIQHRRQRLEETAREGTRWQEQLTQAEAEFEAVYGRHSEVQELQRLRQQAEAQAELRQQRQAGLVALERQLLELASSWEKNGLQLEARQREWQEKRQRRQLLEERLEQREERLQQELGLEKDYAQALSQRLSELASRLQQIREREQSLGRALEEARAQQSQAEQAMTIYQQELKPLEEQSRFLEAQLREFLDRHQLVDEAALRDWLMSGAEYMKLEREVREHEAQLRNSRNQCQELLQRLEGHQPSVELLGEYRTQQASLEQQRQEALQRQGRLREQIERLRQDLAEAAEIRQRHQQAQESLTLHRKLADMLNARNLKAFVANRLLEQILELASSELERLSGRYRLIMQQDDILVVDGWNAGEARDVRSLSGGETFLASLSLALAMIEYLSQGSPLESLFIDEGFGTLDPETLEAVTQTLESLHAKGRLVGVITHVQELAERLPVQVRVEKNQGNSRVLDQESPQAL